MFPEQALDGPRLGRIPAPRHPLGEDFPFRKAVSSSLVSRGLPLALLEHPDKALGAIVEDASRYAMETPEGPVSVVEFSEEGNGCEAGAFVSLQIGDEDRPTEYVAVAADPYRLALAVILSALGLPRTLLATPRDIPSAVLYEAYPPRS
jgi:hypothetical protein